MEGAVYTGSVMQWLWVTITLIGVPVVWGVFNINRGKPNYLMVCLLLYILITFILPLISYLYHHAYWSLAAQSLLFLTCLAMLIALYPKYCFKTEADYQESKPRFDNSGREVMLYPSAMAAFIMGWGIAVVVLGLVFCITMLAAANHALTWQNPYVQLALICILLILAFQLFLRLFPQCPYCRSGLFDFDLRLQAENYTQRHAYLVDSYRILLNVMFLRRFNCRYCKAPFTFKKTDSKVSI